VPTHSREQGQARPQRDQEDEPSAIQTQGLTKRYGATLALGVLALPARGSCSATTSGSAPHVDDAVNKGDSGGVFEEVDVDFVEADGFGSWLLP